MREHPLIVFVCEHGAAKSIIAAAYFNELAAQRGLKLRAIARGTSPAVELSEQAVNGLAKDGLIPTESVPQRLLLDEALLAQRIVSFCKLPEEYDKTTAIEQWEDIPAVSEDYEQARAAIVRRVEYLLNHIRSSP